MLITKSFSHNEPKNDTSFSLGNPKLNSIIALDFGPNNFLFIGDNAGMKIVAIEINKTKINTSNLYDILAVREKIAKQMGVDKSELKIEDIAVHPVNKSIFFGITRTIKKKKQAVLFVLTDEGLHEFDLDKVKYSQKTLSDAPSKSAKIFGNYPKRRWTITDLHFVNNEVVISGLSNEEFSSSLRRIAFPFSKTSSTTSLQAYHVTHRANETHAPVASFTPVKSQNKWHLIAGYSCTPLVSFQWDKIDGSTKLIGRTIAELGAGNIPTGIISYKYKGKNHIMIGNHRHSLIRFSSEDLMNTKEIKYPSRFMGAKRKTTNIGSVTEIVDFDAEHFLVIINDKNKNSINLKVIAKSAV
jgi:hypothetical protein